jgi:putative serine protease PepD
LVKLLLPLAVLTAATSTWLVVSGTAGGASASSATAAAAPSAASLQSQYVAVVKKVAPSVVQIESADGLGSGEILDTKGHIVTNAHVVGTRTSFTVTLANGRRYPGKLEGKFLPDDLAVIKIDATGLRPVVFGSSANLQVGYIVLAIGNPLGLQSSVTDGIVSALGRTVSDPTGGAISQAIQTSAAINPGNSGGALVDLDGRLVGIPTLGVSDPELGGTAAGIGFAIPSDRVKDIAGQIVKYGKVVNSHRAYMGVQLGDTQGQGAYVGDVVAGGPAAKAGIRAGDVITSLGGKPTPSASDFSTVIAGLRPGQTVNVAVTRADGSKTTLKATLGEYPGG